MNNEELNKKLAEFAGIKVLGIIPAGEPKGSLWGEIDMTDFAVYPSETTARSLCDFPQSLTDLFRWITPECNKRHYIASVCTYEGDLCQGRLVPEPKFDYLPIYADWQKKGKEALALSLAVEKLVDKEEKIAKEVKDEP